MRISTDFAADRQALRPLISCPATKPIITREEQAIVERIEEMDSQTGDSLACFWDCFDSEGIQRYVMTDPVRVFIAMVYFSRTG
ncbi:hypothetical protein PR202_ga00698 [Eleusine coracana subsp. coracana]|uniref:Uncharacterized protein n=1 Tax=Eleusine coracana subsp. coracana TaxID=191504 RepID=A0AAV5BEM2_ELECO|nr:hypothetical protein PR202_ga00698 [Eleusine coracana subsp. coracana]